MSIRRRIPSVLRVVGLGVPLWVVGCTPGTFEIPLSTSSAGGSSSDTEVATGSSSDASATAGMTTTGETTTAVETTTTGDSSESSGGPLDCVPLERVTDWWNPGWRRRRALQLDVSALTGSLSNFPVLVRVPAEELGETWSERDGADLRFFAGDLSVEYDYDVDDLGPDGRVVIWVRLPVLDAAAGTVDLWMYYDNPRPDPGPEPADVWVAPYVSVHHLGSDLLDSAGSHHGSSNWEPPPCEGACGPKIGIARTFEPELLHEVILDNPQDYDLGNSPYLESFTFTISLWLRTSSLAEANWIPMVAKGDDSWRVHSNDQARIGVGLDCGVPACEPVIVGGGTNYNPAVAPEYDVNDDQWHHFAATFGYLEEPPEQTPPFWEPETRLRLYVDGEEAFSVDLPFFQIPEDPQPVRIGHNANNQNRFRGALDELRIAYGEKGPEWIAAEFAMVDQELVTLAESEWLCPR